ncbi:hypothetical protein BJ878DRAFT_545029 [Calycina marina]|uniref:Uncharacterized protein n=1 Tax=Calycina marina TaxID=1763456 RepID=A0A9P7YYC7_9HELO|nr:hypothetical protein BJ878DRAFT_545029 [Calycina marina]
MASLSVSGPDHQSMCEFAALIKSIELAVSAKGIIPDGHSTAWMPALQRLGYRDDSPEEFYNIQTAAERAPRPGQMKGNKVPSIAYLTYTFLHHAHHLGIEGVPLRALLNMGVLLLPLKDGKAMKNQSFRAALTREKFFATTNSGWHIRSSGASEDAEGGRNEEPRREQVQAKGVSSRSPKTPAVDAHQKKVSKPRKRKELSSSSLRVTDSIQTFRSEASETSASKNSLPKKRKTLPSPPKSPTKKTNRRRLPNGVDPEHRVLVGNTKVSQNDAYKEDMKKIKEAQKAAKDAGKTRLSEDARLAEEHTAVAAILLELAGVATVGEMFNGILAKC